MDINHAIRSILIIECWFFSWHCINVKGSKGDTSVLKVNTRGLNVKMFYMSRKGIG